MQLGFLITTGEDKSSVLGPINKLGAHVLQLDLVLEACLCAAHHQAVESC